MVMMTERLEARHAGASPGRTYYRRIVLLMCIGLFDSFVLLWPADILLTYALCGLLLFPLRRRSVAALLLGAVVVFGAQAGLRFHEWQSDIEAERTFREVREHPIARETLDPAAARRLSAWEKTLERARPDLAAPRALESMRVMRSGGFREFYAERAKTSLILQTVVLADSWFLDALGAMLLGMALYRTGLLTLRAPARSYLLMAGLGYGLGLPLSLWETGTLMATDFDPLLHARHLIHYDVRRVAISLGHLGSILWLCRTAPGSWLPRHLAAVGRMALSNYLGQSILCGLVFYAVGLGLYGRFTGYYLYIVVLLVWALQVAFSNWWLARYRFGPAEWLWRSLTYGSRQAMLCEVRPLPAP